MATEMLTLRVSSKQKTQLETLASQQGCSVSDVIRGWIDTDQITVEVPEEYADIVRLCALLKGQTVPEFVREYFTDYLTHDSIGICEHFGSILAERIKQILREKGPLTEDELLAELPERVRNMNMDDFMSIWLHYYVQKTPDGKYELKAEGIITAYNTHHN